ncbi:MAG: serine/threonine-protein kinase [Gemmataceae bacterium]
MKAPSARRDNLNCMRPVGVERESRVLKYLEQLFQSGIVARADWDRLDPRAKLELKGLTNLDRFLLRLVDHRILTAYQAARLQSGQTHGLLLGPYRLLERLGAGASSVVFKGEHIETRARVALKILIPGQRDDTLLLRFETERRSIGQLDHPSIVKMLDAGEAENSDPDAPLLYYYAMELLPAVDLESYVLQHGPLSIDLACRLAYQIASALDCAHGHGVVHRDIKPANILWTEDQQAKLFDFGLARGMSHRHTQPGVPLGTLEYAAPEQGLDGASADIRADIFGLGSTLYFTLTRQPPFCAKGRLDEVIQRRRTAPPPSAQFLNDKVTPRLDALLARMMALDPADRFQTPRQLMIALEEFIGPQEIPLREAGEETSVSVATREMEPDAEASGRRAVFFSPSGEMPEAVEAAATSLGLLCEVTADLSALHATLTRTDPDLLLLDFEGSTECPPWLGELPKSADFRKTAALAHAAPPRGALAAEGSAGIDDFITLPQEPAAVKKRLRRLLTLQEAERRTAARTPAPPEPEAAPTEPTKKKGGFWSWLKGRRG